MTDGLLVRVRVLDAWDDIPFHLSPPTPISNVKRQALAAARVTEPAEHFLVKFRGAEVSDESRSLAEAGVPNGGALIVLRRRRIPVR